MSSFDNVPVVGTFEVYDNDADTSVLPEIDPIKKEKANHSRNKALLIHGKVNNIPLPSSVKKQKSNNSKDVSQVSQLPQTLQTTTHQPGSSSVRDNVNILRNNAVKRTQSYQSTRVDQTSGHETKFKTSNPINQPYDLTSNPIDSTTDSASNQVLSTNWTPNIYNARKKLLPAKTTTKGSTNYVPPPTMSSNINNDLQLPNNHLQRSLLNSIDSQPPLPYITQSQKIAPSFQYHNHIQPPIYVPTIINRNPAHQPSLSSLLLTSMSNSFCSNINSNLVQQQVMQILSDPSTTQAQITSLMEELMVLGVQIPSAHTTPLDYVRNIATSSTAVPQTNYQPPAGRFHAKPSEDELLKEDENVGAEPEEFRDVEMYADYMPCKLKIGQPHPDPVVETNSLSTVEPPDIFYKLKLPNDLINKGYLSSLQIEAVTYACQSHSQFDLQRTSGCRPGFLIGDGAGVGKGRTIAGIIYENYLQGRKKSIWISVSIDLQYDARRDLDDITAKHISIKFLGKLPYGKRIPAECEVIFSTYSSLVSKSQTTRQPYSTRLNQLLSWAGPKFDGVIVFDECHKAKNINPTKSSLQSKTATAVLELQEKLPFARIVYASATGATETRNLGYMTRLRMWGQGTPYENFAAFRSSIDRRGVGAMELVAVDLKLRGYYIARQLSFKNTTFSVQVADLTKENRDLYDACVDMWADAYKFFLEASKIFHDDKKIKRTLWSTFWGAHQKFFRYLCIGFKVPLVINIAKDAVKNEKCVVIGLQSTGEAKTNDILEEKGEIFDYISTAKAVYESLIYDHYPVPEYAKKRNTDSDTEDEDEDSTNEESCSTSSSISPVKSRLRGSSSKDKAPMSSRALRAKARTMAKTKTRIKKMPDSSDTDVSNALSSCSAISHLTTSDDSYNSESESSSGATDVNANDDNDDDEMTPTKKRLQKSIAKNVIKKPLSSSDTDECEITATVKPKSYELIVLSSDEDEPISRPVSSQSGSKHSNSNLSTDKVDPMVIHAKNLIENRDRMLSAIKPLSSRLPHNTLDELVNKLGGADAVAEMTGRKGRLLCDDDGIVSYKTRNVDTSEMINIEEKKCFMNGQKLIAIISEAASSGISLQADRRAKNQRRRVHITIELPWSADKAIQQFGRTHRSNQVSGPEYIFIISSLAGERRFASIVAKRLESLGALTHGDRRSTTQTRELHQFNIMGKYSHDALLQTLRFIEHDGNSQQELMPSYSSKQKFISDAKKGLVDTGIFKFDKGYVQFDYSPNAINMQIFLNRLLGMKVDIQNALFQLFTNSLERLIRKKKFAGQYDSGIIELTPESGNAECSEPICYNLKTKTSVVQCNLWQVKIERGIDWSKAKEMLALSNDERSGFYKSYNPITQTTIISLYLRDKTEGALPDQFRMYKPNIGLDPVLYFYEQFKNKSNLFKVKENDAESLWRKIYDGTKDKCSHLCIFNTCSRVKAGMQCDIGLRYRNYTILSGGVLTAWPYIEKMNYSASLKLQVVRLALKEKNRIIGALIPQDLVNSVKDHLQKGQTDGVNFF